MRALEVPQRPLRDSTDKWCLFMVLTMVLVSPQWVRGDLIAHYTLDGNANDLAGGRNGTLLGDATFSSNVPTNLYGISSQSLALDGSLDKVIYDVPTGDTVSGSFTVAMWVDFAERRPFGTLTFFGSRAPSDGSFDFKLDTDNHIRLDLGNGSVFPIIHDTPAFPVMLNTWYHVAVAVSPTSFSIYLNGSLFDSGSFSGFTPLLWDANHDIAIGAISASSDPNGPPTGEDFHGLIDDVRVYGNALTAGEIHNLYSPSVPEPSSLVLLGVGGLALIGYSWRRQVVR